MGYTVLQLIDRLQTEADAYLFMEELRWGDGEPECPHCGNLGASYIRRGRYLGDRLGSLRCVRAPCLRPMLRLTSDCTARVQRDSGLFA